MESQSSKANKIPNWLQKVLFFIGGFAATQGFAIFFDYVIYPIVTYRLGFWKSLAVLFTAAVLLNYLFVLIYDRLKKDLFGFEALKRMKENGEVVGNRKLLHRVMKWGKIPVFIIFSWYDPIFAVLYSRKSTQFDGFSRRDYGILLLSTAVGCIIWSGAWTFGIYILKQLFAFI